jgi:hypothetical protein
MSSAVRRDTDGLDETFVITGVITPISREALLTPLSGLERAAE